ncbi:MAG TPA: ankyrin repeat domain-containing protein [Planctomycetaceae bacterium]|nr:ankyrin repeat domain-containing protein [Planctomycetaceae bacterium]
MLSLPTAASVERIEIFTRWVGFADPPTRTAKLVIVRRGDSFVRELFPARTIDDFSAERVSQLLLALSRPAVAQLEPALFDIPEPVIRRQYESVWTDDNPEHLIRVLFQAGRTITIRTDVQKSFMLPLKVSDSAAGNETATFDPIVSRTIAALMPDGYLEKDRLAGSETMLEWDLEESAGRTDPVPAAPGESQVNEWPDDVVKNAHDVFDEIARVLLGYETAEQRLQTERSGRISDRLLRRISLDDMRRLLACGADPKIADELGQTALMFAAWPPFDRERFRLLVEAGADVNARRNDGFTGLHLACAGGESATVEEWIRAGADIHARTGQGVTPLMLAVGWPRIVPLLLSAGAAVNFADGDGHTALVYAILKQCTTDGQRQLESIRAMIEAGADVNRRDNQGSAPLGHARCVLAESQLEHEVEQVLAAKTSHGDSAQPGRKLDLGGTSKSSVQNAEAVVHLLISTGAVE